MRAATAHAMPWWMNSRPCAPFNGESRKLSPLAGDAAPPGSAGEPTLNCRDEGVRAPLVAVRHVRWRNLPGVAGEKSRFPIDRKKLTEVRPRRSNPRSVRGAMSRSFHIGQRRRRMKRLLGFAIGAFVLMAAGAAVAAPPGPGQKFDCSQGGSGISCASDDTGCVPQSKDVPTGNVSTLKCGDGLSKAFAGAIRAVIKCHAKMASSVLKLAPVDDEACESNDPVKHKSAKEKLDAAIAKIAPLCTSTQLTLAAGFESTLFASKTNPSSLDAQAAAVYCDGSTSIDPAGAGGDDAGTIDTAAADAANRLKCANAVGSELGKLIAAATKCHV